ncbi:MAG: CHAT domain-containing protein, partial [Anaerolineae bacterium]|nr:CHAT domain-containing protein [Anaerolineae bacterium]
MPNPLDLEMSLERGDGGTYEVTLRARLDAENEWEEGPFVVQIDLAALLGLVGNPEGYGRVLSGSLFSNSELRAAFAAARGRAGTDGMRLRIRAARNVPELLKLQWELLVDPEGDSFLSTREDVVLSRYLARRSTGGTASLPGRKSTLRWVAAVANPADLEDKYSLATIDVAAEHSRFGSLAGVEVSRIPASDTEGRITTRCTLANLIEHARDADVLYLACHGRMINNAPWLLLEDEDGLAARISGKRLVEAVQGMAGKPRLIVLASCESGGGTGDAFSAIGPRLVAAGVPAVVAMQGLVTMTLVDDFMPIFFRELVRDGRIDRALAFARRACREDHPDWWSPVLYMNLRSGQLWQEIEISTPGGSGHTVIGSSNIVIGDITHSDGVTIIVDRPGETPKMSVPHEIDKPEYAFFGRVDELTNLHTAVCDQEAQVIEIYGLGGTGKTTLAKVLVAGIRKDFIFGLGLDTASPEKVDLARKLAAGIKDSFPDGQVYLNLRGSGGLPDSKEQQPLKAIPALRSVLESFGINPG